jgi:hypothetical protein
MSAWRDGAEPPDAHRVAEPGAGAKVGPRRVLSYFEQTTWKVRAPFDARALAGRMGLDLSEGVDRLPPEVARTIGGGAATRWPGLPSREARMDGRRRRDYRRRRYCVGESRSRLASSPQAKLVALCDPDARTLHEASQQTGITRVFADHRALLDNPVVDAVHRRHSEFHATRRFVLDAIAAGKHVLCEKPLAPDLPSRVGDVPRPPKPRACGTMTAFHLSFRSGDAITPKYLIERRRR